jgi:hypothetical protein
MLEQLAVSAGASDRMLFLCAGLAWAGYTVAMRQARLDGLHAAAIAAVDSLVLYVPVYAAGDPERSFGCGAPDHHRGHGSRAAEKARARPRHASGRRHGWHGLLSPSIERPKVQEGLGIAAGAFLLSVRVLVAQ